MLPELKEPYAVIYAGDITSEIRRAAALLEKETPDVIPVRENDSIIVLRPDEIYMIRADNERTYIPKQSGMTAASGFTNLKRFSGKGLCGYPKGRLRT